jgi:hypothetical protein
VLGGCHGSCTAEAMVMVAGLFPWRLLELVFAGCSHLPTIAVVFSRGRMTMLSPLITQ